MHVVGDQCVVFGHAIVGHGATLRTGVVVAPGAVINARVNVGDFAYIGSNASILPDLSVGQAATVAANSAAMVDVEPETTVLGVPAEIVGHPSDEAVPRPPLTSVEMGPAKDLSALEARVRKAFEDVLGRKDIAGNGNFFDNGGTSALLLTLGSRLHQELDVRVSAVDLLRTRPSSTTGNRGGVGSFGETTILRTVISGNADGWFVGGGEALVENVTTANNRRDGILGRGI